MVMSNQEHADPEAQLEENPVADSLCNDIRIYRKKNSAQVQSLAFDGV